MKLGLDSRTIFDIVMVGTGATGSQLLPFLSQLLAHFPDNRLTIIDGDVFEAKNLKNQKCTPDDIGKSKAEVLCERYQSVYPDLKIVYVDEYIKNVEQFFKITGFRSNSAGRMPVLISCVDNNASRKLFDDIFHDKKVNDLIYIDSGNGTVNRVGQVVTGLKLGETGQVPDHTGNYDYFASGRKNGKVILPPVAEFYPEIRTEAKTVEQTVGCIAESAEAPQNIATNIMAASTIFTIINNIVAFGEINSSICYFNAERPDIVSRGGEKDG